MTATAATSHTAFNPTYTMTADDTSASQPHNHYEEFQIHPGITTIISFAGAVVLVIVYLYYENVFLCVKRACLRKRPPDKVASENAQATSNGNHVVRNDSNSDYAEKVHEEPGVLCECGRIHLLKDCLKEDDLHAYKDMLGRIASSTSPDDAGCEIINETTANSSEFIRGSDKNEERISTDSREPPLSNGSTGSSPRCVTPLIRVKPAHPLGVPHVVYSHAGKMPTKECNSESDVS